jgi:hypothetical protein
VTHAELVTFAERWLRAGRRLPIVLCDVRCVVVSEMPDAIGFTNRGYSVLVECKASRADFARDEKKWFRRAPELGMGYERWFCAPPGIIRVEELPPQWGFLEPRGPKRARIIRKPGRFLKRNERDERALLVLALRRATEGWGRRIFGEIAPPLVDGDPHPTAGKIIRDLRDENRRLRAAMRPMEKAR